MKTNLPRFMMFVILMSIAVAVGLNLNARESELLAPPEGIDFSVLTTDNPITEFNVSGEKVYKQALADGWKSLSDNKSKKWIVPYKDDCFKVSASVFDKPPFNTYLVSPALDLTKIGGKELTFLFKITYDNELPLKVFIIDRKGETIKEIFNQSPQTKKQYEPGKAIIPQGLSGIGFIAFNAQSFAQPFNEFALKDIILAEGSNQPTISSDKTTIEWDAINVGETSVHKSASIIITNNEATPKIELTGEDKDNFSVVDQNSLTAIGGNLSFVFVPKSEGRKNATAIISLGEVKCEIKLSGLALKGNPNPEPDPEPNPDPKPEIKDNIELLKDQFFENFDQNDSPREWETKGDVRKTLKGYHPNTGFGIQLVAKEIPSAIWQKVDLTQEGKEVSKGDVLEGMIHYRGLAPKNPNGSLRLSCYWTDAQGKKITSEEDLFINNDHTYFDKQLAWGELKFRATAPEGAKFFVFGVETNKHAIAEVDDFSLLKLKSLAVKTEFVSIIPGMVVLNGEINKPIHSHILVQGYSLTGERKATINGPEGVLVMAQDKLPQGNSVQDIAYTITAKEKGIYGLGRKNSPFKIIFNNNGEKAECFITANIIDGDNKPSIKLAGENEIDKMSAYPQETSTQEITFDINNVIDHINISIKQGDDKPFKINTGQFYYSEKQDKALSNKLTITFAPKESKEYKATLCLTTTGTDTVKYELTGIGLSRGEGWSEKFEADQKMDPRFVGGVWKGYHKFDRGYYKLDGAWKDKNEIILSKGGMIECDELFDYGIQKLSVTPEETAKDLKIEISIDGGGHWVALENKDLIDSHRPTRFRLVNTSAKDLTINSIDLDLSDKEHVQKFKSIEDAMILGVDKEPLNKLEEYFESERHTRDLIIPGWQNITLKGNRAFRGWDHKNLKTREIEERCAQISFYNSQVLEDTGEMQSWLISPTISYKAAESKVLTFRIRYELPQENSPEKFGVWIITEDNKAAKAQYLDITQYTMVKNPEDDTWIDYCIELDKVEDITINDKFHVAFSFDSPSSGKDVTLTFKIDDVTFGRTDITKPIADTEGLTFNFIPNVKTDPQKVKITVENPKNPLSVILIPKRLTDSFIIDKEYLPKDGGDIEVRYFSKEDKQRAAALLVQSRGGQSVMIKLLAMKDTSAELIEEQSNIKVYPTVAKEAINIDGQYHMYYVFNMAGQLIMSGNYTKSLDINAIPSGKYILRLVSEMNTIQTKSFIKE
ncbi:choice-of-anchor J domain-containing protein [Falsiporphyromonas endometrii]|uniref:Choice-of-anchor J domain-containing protein n=1 Tax=Falsiporphyromonas endometrii TaxID=1387297 RepID=A0ABV9K5L6_9PORP